MTTKILSIGNGESRSEVNLHCLPFYKIGCNAIIRDYSVDELVCVDRRMFAEALRMASTSYTQLHTRPENVSSYADSGLVRSVPLLPFAATRRCDRPEHWGSGPYAVLIAAQRADEVWMLGFDLYGNAKNHLNNLYKDTDNYPVSSKQAVDPRYWIEQTGMIMDYYSGVTFCVFQKPGWILPDRWKKPNTIVDTIENLKYYYTIKQE